MPFPQRLHQAVIRTWPYVGSRSLGRLSCYLVSKRHERANRTMFPCSAKTHHLVYHPNHQAAAGTHSDVLPVLKIHERNLKPVATGAWVVVYLQLLIPGHVLDFDLVVDGHMSVCHFVFKGLADECSMRTYGEVVVGWLTVLRCLRLRQKVETNLG